MRPAGRPERTHSENLHARRYLTCVFCRVGRRLTEETGEARLGSHYRPA